MAYTYDTFLNAAKNAGLYDTFSPEDLTTAQKSPEYGLSLLKLQQDAGKATTEEQKLLVQEAINQLRNTYGPQTSTTAPAATTAPVATTAPATGSFTYDNDNSYQKLLDDVAKPEPFQYDHRQDSAYGAVKDSWVADGDATREKVMNAPSASQGVQSSWAGTVTQQSNNYYDTKLNDQIPAMRQNAYQEYLAEQANDQSKLDALAADRDFKYAVDVQQKQLEQEAAQQKFDNALTLSTEFGTEAPAVPDLSGLADGTSRPLNIDGMAQYIAGQAGQAGHTVDQNTVSQYLAALAGNRTTAPTVDADAVAQYIAGKAAENGYTVDAGTIAQWINGLKAANETGYTYEKGSEYQEALNDVINQAPFEYSHLEDPLYGSLRKTNLREGERAAADTLAELNAATGGVANSYSLRAATDAGNAYNENLNAGITGLRQNAYQEYLDAFEGKLQGLSQLGEDRAFDYQEWLQQYQLQEAARQQEFNNALALYEQIGLTPEIAAILGVPYEEPKSSSGSGGGNGGSKNYTITNKNALNEAGTGWIQIGGGRISQSSLDKKIASGEVIETADKKSGTITYTYASKK